MSVVLGAALMAAFAVRGQNEEQAFLRQAVQANIAEVRLGELAAQRADSDAVRTLGKTVRADHQAALEHTTRVARSLGVEPPTEPATEEKGFYDGLSQLTGAQFDAVLVSHLIMTHQAEIASYSRHANSSNDAVAALVAEALPKQRAHLATAQALQRGVPASSGH